jgi:hypothetical protein
MTQLTFVSEFSSAHILNSIHHHGKIEDMKKKQA